MKELHGANVKETTPTLVDNDILSYTTDLEKAHLFGKFLQKLAHCHPLLPIIDSPYNLS